MDVYQAALKKASPVTREIVEKISEQAKRGEVKGVKVIILNVYESEYGNGGDLNSMELSSLVAPKWPSDAEGDAKGRKMVNRYYKEKEKCQEKVHKAWQNFVDGVIPESISWSEQS